MPVRNWEGRKVDFSLRRRPRTDDYDIVGDDQAVFGQVIHSADGYTVYLLGDFERLFPPFPSADDALEGFEEWAASNTVSDIPTISADPPK
jgi:hypothetical protein